MKFLVLSFLVGCGSIPCDEGYDLFVKGMCISSGFYEANPENLETSIDLLELHFNLIFDVKYSVDIERLIVRHDVTLEFVKDLGGVLGKTRFPDEISPKVRIFALGPSCWHRNYIMIHELLHVIARYHLHVLETDDHHYVPKLFVTWAVREELPKDTTVEYNVGQDIAQMCSEQE